MTNTQIEKNFFKSILTTEGISVTDFNTIKKYEEPWIDPDFQPYIIDMLWSLVIAEKLTYIYLVLRIKDRLPAVFCESLIEDAISKIQQWHQQKHPSDSEEAIIKVIRYECEANSTAEADDKA